VRSCVLAAAQRTITGEGGHPNRQPHQAAQPQAPRQPIQKLTPIVTTTPLTSDLLVIACSNGENLKLAERFATQAQSQALQAQVLDLTALDLPLFTPRALAAGAPSDLAALEQKLAGATRWVICAPEYNGTIPPVLTSAIAWLSVQGDDFRALFNGKPVAIATHSGGGGHAVLAALRLQLAHLGAHVVGRQLVSNNASPAKDESIADLIHRLKQLQPLQP
jgi:chromate reductase